MGSKSKKKSQKKVNVVKEDLVEEIKEKNKNVNLEENDINKKKHKFYFSYSVRLVVYCLLFIFFLVMSILMFKNNLNINENTNIIYNESSNLDYKVYLKKNDFYETPYLEKNMIYVASLIDYINVDFNYDFNITDKTNLSFKYDVIAKILIRDDSEKNTYFEKEYSLLTDSVLLKEEDKYKINKSVKIDYGYYNSLANKFKTSYGVDTKSSLVVYLNVYKSNVNDGDYSFSDTKQVSLTIPLSEKAINIKMDYQNINDSKEFILDDGEYGLKNGIFFFAATLLLLAAIGIFTKIIRFIYLLKGKKTFYDRYVSKILKEYDRLIVESKTLLPFDEYKIIKIERFEELLDVRDNLKLPIMYYNVTAHQKCYFYIRHEDIVYLLTIKEVDLEENKNAK